MKFFAALSLVSLASGFAIVPRATDNSQAILANLTTLEGDIKNLNDTLNQNDNNTPYNFYQLGAINVYTQQLANDTNSTTATANSSTVATAAESKQIYDKINTSTSGKIYSLLQNIVNHKPAFDQGGISPTVLQNLQSQRELTRELGNALTAKADPSYTSASSTLSSQILAKFDQAIKAYS